MSVFNMFDDNFGQAEVISVKATQERKPKQGLRTVSIPLPYWVEELVEGGKLFKVQVEAARQKEVHQEGHLSFAILPLCPTPLCRCSFCKSELHLVTSPRGKNIVPHFEAKKVPYLSCDWQFWAHSKLLPRRISRT